MIVIRLCLCVVALCCTALPSFAEVLGQPTDRVLLQVTGEISHTNNGDMAEFDLKMLRELDWHEIRSFTSFTVGEQVFSGPTMASVLAAVGARGSRINAMAINDYYAEIPVAHANDHRVLLAVEMNGERMRVRDKGPIWVIYPMSKEAAEQKPYDTEMVWQLNRLQVLP